MNPNNYTDAMEKMSFLDELKTLTANENVLSVSRDVNELRTRFDDYVLEEERKKQQDMLDAQAAGETGGSTVSLGDYGQLQLK